MAEQKRIPPTDRKAPVGTFWDAAANCYRAQITIVTGRRFNRQLRTPSGEPARTEEEARAAMAALVAKLIAEGKLNRTTSITKFYSAKSVGNLVYLNPPANDASEHQLPEIPAPLHEEIASWRRIMHSGTEPREHFRRAARDLFAMLKVAGDSALNRQAVTDALQEFADFHGIGADDAQRIMAEGSEAAVASGPVTAPAAPAPAPSWRDRVIAAQDLCDQRFPDVRFLVPGLFPEGVTLLVSRPKLGKSWLLLQIGSSIAGGVSALVSADEPACGNVLYLSLEDNDRRVQRRMTKHFGARRECWPLPLQIVTVWRRLDTGGLDDLREWCRSVAKPTLIMIDTLKKVRPPKKNGKTDYDADYEACEGLVGLAHEFPGLAFIVAHHDRKMAADDVYDTVSGTLGLTGGVDTIAILKRSGTGVTLYVQGRDLVDDVEKAVKFDRETCRWVILGEAVEAQRSAERASVLASLRNAPAGGMGVREIMADAKIRTQEAAWQILHRMTEAGEIVRCGRGKYGLSGDALSGVSGTSGGGPIADGTRRNNGPDVPDTPDRQAET